MWGGLLSGLTLQFQIKRSHKALQLALTCVPRADGNVRRGAALLGLPSVQGEEVGVGLTEGWAIQHRTSSGWGTRGRGSWLWSGGWAGGSCSSSRGHHSPWAGGRAHSHIQQPCPSAPARDREPWGHAGAVFTVVLLLTGKYPYEGTHRDASRLLASLPGGLGWEAQGSHRGTRWPSNSGSTCQAEPLGRLSVPHSPSPSPLVHPRLAQGSGLAGRPRQGQVGGEI